MNAITSAQFEYDNRQPLPVSETPLEAATRQWIDDGVEQLLLRTDVRWTRRGGVAKSVTYDDFRDRVQCHLVDRQKAGEDQCDAFADLALSAMSGVADKASASYLLGTAQTLRGLAVELLSPHAADGVEALREEAEDDL